MNHLALVRILGLDNFEPEPESYVDISLAETVILDDWYEEPLVEADWPETVYPIGRPSEGDRDV